MVSNLHPRDASGIHGSRSVIGMALLHDFGVEGGVHAETLARVRQVLKAFGLFTQGRIEFIPYWRSRDAAIFSVPQVPVSLYRNLDSGEVLAVLLNPGKTEAVGTLELDGTGLGLAGCTATDPEAVEPAAGLAVTGTARRPGISVSVAGREYRLVLVEPAGR
jgi:hypothetical protein